MKQYNARSTGPSGFGREPYGHRAAMRPPGMQPRTQSTSKPTPPRQRSSARVGYHERYSLAWPGTDTALDNDQLQTFAAAAARLGLGDC
jgi:hypothetical protein